MRGHSLWVSLHPSHFMEKIMQDKYLCHKCGMRFRYEIRMYDPNALYLDTKSPDLLIKTEKGRSVGCFYCFPIRRVAKGYVYFGDLQVNQNIKSVAQFSQSASDEARVYDALPKKRKKESALK